jgi:AraC-like DNA-binding protein
MTIDTFELRKKRFCMLNEARERRYQNLARPLDRVVFSTANVVAARFQCGRDDPRFRDSGPTSHFIVTFPRTSVWICYSGSPGVVADPTVSTIYNAGQEFTRAPLSPDGDRCEWLAVSPEIARAIAASLDDSAMDRADRPFAPEIAQVDHRLYLAQRRLFARLDHGTIGPLEAEETIIGYVHAVLRSAYGNPYMGNPGPAEAHRDLVQRTRAELARSVGERITLGQLASRLGTSPFHLCRVFRDCTGMTLHDFRLEIRLRTGLERLADSGADISRIALELGFSSHSHFSSIVRRRYGSTPRSLRAALA